MTSPTSVGEVSVEVVANAKALAKSLRKEVESAFKGLDVSKAIRDAVGTRTIKLRVEPEVDTKSIPAKVKGTRIPKVPVEVDPLLAQFQQQVRRQIASLGRQLNASIPVGADTDGLRAQLGAALKAVQAQSRIQIPTEPGAKAEYESKLKRDLDEVAARVKQTVHVDVDVDKGRGGGIGSVLSGIANLTKALPGLGRVSAGLADIGSSIQKMTGSSAQLGGNLAGAFLAVTGPIGVAVGLSVSLASAIGGVTIAAFALGPALGLVSAGLASVAGLAAAIPAALAGAGAAIGTLALGFQGIAEAFKPKAGGGGGGANSAVNQARQIAAASRSVEAARRGIASANRGLQSAERGLEQAEDGVAKAQDRARLAQQAVNRARREAAEDLTDLNRQLRGAQLGEEEAALAVTDALRELNDVKQFGNIPDIQRAQLAYERAKLTLEDATDSAQDLGEAASDANKKGVEGSDKVQDALRDQVESLEAVEQAQEGVLDAQNALLSAQDGLKSSYDGLTSAQDSLAQAQQKVASGAGGVAKEVTKLAPAAQKFVDAIKALKPAFEDLRLDVQQRLFAGLDKTVTNLGKAWIPALRTTLGSYADTFNNFFKNLGTAVTTPKFITDLQIGAEGARQGLAKIGDSITTSLVPAFGALSRAAGPFLTKLGEEIAGIVTDFSNWVLQGEKTGGLTSFFDRATEAMHDLFNTGKLVSSIIGSIFEIITGADSKDSSGRNALQKFNDQLGKLAKYLKDPQTQQKIRDFIGDVKDLAKKFTDAGDSASTLLTKFKKIRSILFGPGPEEQAVGKQNGINMGGSPIASEDTKTQSYSLGEDIGSALVLGILAGISGTLDLEWAILGSLIWKGPNSLVGRIKSGLGIASPSTVMMEIGRNIIEGLFEGIGQIGGLLDRVCQLPGQIRDGLGDMAATVRKKGADAIGGIITGIGDRFPGLRDKAKQAKNVVSGAVSDAGDWLRGPGKSAVSGLMTGISDRFASLRGTATQIKNTIFNALSGAGSWLWAHGYNSIVGLWQGISSLGGWLYNRVANFVRNNIVNPVRDYLHIGSPSKLMAELGAFTTEGFAIGMDSRAGLVEDAAENISNLAVPDLGTAGFGADLDASISRSLSVATKESAQLAWKTGTTGDQFLDALAGLIDIRHNGDVQAALSRG